MGSALAREDSFVDRQEEEKDVAVVQFCLMPSMEVFIMHAAGIRNTVGFDWDANGTLYFTNNGIDQLGNNLPDDALNVAPKAGLFYGFPYCHV